MEDKNFVLVRDGKRISENLTQSDATAKANEINSRLNESAGEKPVEIKSVVNG